MNGTCSSALLSLLMISAVYGASVDIFPAKTALVNKGQNLDIVCSNVKPSTWYSVSIIVVCYPSGNDITAGLAANKPAENCFQTLTPIQILGETRFACNFTVFVFSILRVPITANNCRVGCQVYVLDGTTETNFTSIAVKEPLGVPTIKPSEKQTIQEINRQQFQCSSQSFPPAEIKWYINDRNIAAPSTSHFNSSTSNLMYTANRTDNGKHLYCTASNKYESSNSINVILNITYFPDVELFPNYSTYKVVNGTKSLTLHCNVIDANPAVYQYEWFKARMTLDNNINHTISDVSTKDDDTYTCSARNAVGRTNSSEIKLDVLYGVQLVKPEKRQPIEGTILSVKCSGYSNPPFTDNNVKWTKQNDSKFNATGQLVKNVTRNDSGIYICNVMLLLEPSKGPSVEVTGNTTVQVDVLFVPETHIEPTYSKYILYKGQQNIVLQCVVEVANPIINITYNWTKPAGAVTGNSLNIIEVGIHHEGIYTCIAYNKAGSSKPAKQEIEVQYAPSISNVYNKTVTEGDTLMIDPTIEAKPDPTSVFWTRESDNFKYPGIKLTLDDIRRTSGDYYTIHVENILTPSNSTMMTKISEKKIFVDVQFVPETHIEPTYNKYILYKGQQNVVLQCVVEVANPITNITYSWTKPAGAATGNSLNIIEVGIHHEGIYACIAYNKAGSSKPAKQEIEVQYAPSISNVNNKTVTEGDTLMIDPTIEAKPDPTSVFWTRESDNFKYPGVKLTLDDIRRTSGDYYTIHVENILTPSNSTMMTKISEKKIFVDVQYPPSVAILESTYHQVVEHDKLSLHCTVEDANPPASSVKWNSVGSDKANFTIQNISRTEAGNYTCKAENAVGVDLQNVYVDVLYVPSVTLLRISNGSMVAENATVVIQCSIDSNPRSVVQLNLKNGDKREVLIGTTSSYFTISSVDCFDTGAVECTATNDIFNNVYNATKQIPLYVLCSPRLDKYKQQPDNKLGLPAGGNLNITVYLVAYPRPSKITWNFRQNLTSNSIQLNSNDTTTGVFRHTVCLLKVNLTEQEFGLYTLDVENDIGKSSTTFTIVPEGPPDRSKILNTSCIAEQATVFWETSFNGGDTQHFYLIVYTKDKEYKTVQTDIMSETRGEVKHKSITLSNGYYSFRVMGKNQYGNATTLDDISCSIKGKTKTEDSSVVAKAAGGGIGAAVALIGAISIVFFILKKRRHLTGKQQDPGRSKLTDEDKDNDDGLKDNPLYETSQNTKDNNRDVYSQVNKAKSSECNQDVIDGGTVYSLVQKKQNKKEKQKDMEMGDIYENSDKIMRGHHTDKIYANTGNDAVREKSKNGENYQPKQNKDGLVYADLDLAPCGKRFVIRGIENRNNYAIIDLTKTAEPLPLDDDENEEENTNHEISTAVVE